MIKILERIDEERYSTPPSSSVLKITNKYVNLIFQILLNNTIRYYLIVITPKQIIFLIGNKTLQHTLDSFHLRPVEDTYEKSYPGDMFDIEIVAIVGIA